MRCNVRIDKELGGSRKRARGVAFPMPMSPLYLPPLLSKDLDIPSAEIASANTSCKRISFIGLVLSN